MWIIFTESGFLPLRRMKPKLSPPSNFSCIVLAALITLIFSSLLFLYCRSYPGTELILHPFDVTKDVIQNKDYAIVFDGGSTGTRVHIFTFLIDDNLLQQKIHLDSESFAHIKPGLSSYATNISAAVESLEPLLAHTFKHVPSRLASNTPLILKATAGLRLLPHNSADLILESVRNKLNSTPYFVEEDAVGMLDEKDEGLFAWYTINFLLKRLHNITSSVAALDLGGGSTQVTFSTNDIHTLITSPASFIIKRSIEGQPEYIYTHSYLGNGLMSSRASILELGNVRETHFNNRSSATSRLMHHIDHPCFRSLENLTHHWSFADTDYLIKFQDVGSLNTFEACYELVQRFVDLSNIDKPDELVRREVHLMSYFYDRMKDIKFIKQESGWIKVRDYFLYAEHVCDGTIRIKRQDSFLCLDLVYIASYLHDGLGLPLNKDIFLVKKFNGIEISWALGAAINLFHFS